MFDDIGYKIKTYANVLTWIGIVCSFIVGITIMFTSSFLLGVLIIALGSLSSWLGSFLLYGFGELIENTDSIKKSLYRIEIMQKNETIKNQPAKPSASHRWKCDNCGKFTDKSPCIHCGYSAKSNQNIVDKESVKPPYKCGKCGKDGPYGDFCPDCGSTIKYYSADNTPQNKTNTQSAILKCKNCGAENPSKNKFCFLCGNNLDVDPKIGFLDKFFD